MKVSQLTKNRRARRGSPRLSLFPFLAVLICTMGALVPLLLFVMRQAKIQAVHESAAKIARRQEGRKADVQAERELVQWRIEQLRQSRQATEKDLTDCRLVLGHLEDHARRLREQLARLRANGQSLEAAGDDLSRRRLGTLEELEKLKVQVAEAQRRVDEARQEALKRPRSYAVIPYRGPQETHRRPIYLECRADRIVLQPEGIEFVEDDFDGPPGSGNPLATALRAAREYLMTQGGFDPQRDGEPYPLLLVRPAGIMSYYAAQTAMASWRSEFGYELIGDDWPLVFPQRDPQLARTVDQAVGEARIRQQAIVAAAPSRFRSASSKPSYRVAANGAVVPDNSPSADGPSGYRSRPFSPRLGSSYSTGGGTGTASGTPGGGYGSGGTGTGGGTGVSSGTPGGGYGSGGIGTGGGTGIAGGTPGGGYGSGGTGTGGGTGVASGTPGIASGTPAGGYGGQASTGTTPNNAAGNAAGNAVGNRSGNGSSSGGQARPVEIPEGYVAGQPRDGPPPPRRDPPADAGPGSPLRPGEWYPSPDQPDPKDKAEAPKKASLAKKRGRDWGLRDASEAAVPVTRPIRIDCYADRLVLVPGEGNHSRTIPLDGPAEASIDKFISAVWEHMDSWGIAGKGMYWRPVLTVRVAPGGQQRFAEISSLLEDSGLAVERKPE